MRAEELLNRHGPYCCEAVNFDGGDEYSANVYRTAPELHVIMHHRFDTLIESAKLKDSDFDLPRWYQQMVVHTFAPEHQSCFLSRDGERMGSALAIGAQQVLECEIPWPGLDPPDLCRFTVKSMGYNIRIYDMYLSTALNVPAKVFENIYLDLPNYYAVQVRKYFRRPWFSLRELEGELKVIFADPVCENNMAQAVEVNTIELDSGVELNAASNSLVLPGTYTAIQRNAGIPRDFTQLIPEPVVVIVHINGHPARTLIDSGSLSDFMSAELAHQLGIKAFELEKPIPVHLAVQGSRAMINTGCRATVEYQRVKTDRYFDVVNLLNYNIIPGTPFLYQHKVSFSFNPTTVVIGSSQALQIEGKNMRILQSHAADVLEDQLEAAREELRQYAAPICKEASDSPLPPLRAINHRIPLVDEEKVYSW